MTVITVLISSLSIIMLILFYRAYTNTRQVVVNHISINTTPEISKHKLAILHISDMHLEHISITPMQILEQFKDQSIDIIALTGDFLDRKRSIPKLIPYLEVFSELAPKHGIYAVFGNHDYVLKQKNFNVLKQT